MTLSKVVRVGNKVEDIIVSHGEEVFMGANKNAMGHIINLLTDIYTNPIQATVREVVSNATDATALLPVSERKPIKITIPSLINPVFSVEDFGVGMSLDTVKTVYSQYGVSTKTHNFDTIGAFGLGAKAPLSYTQEFNVVTTKDGVTTSFLVSRKELGNFSKILKVEETGLPNGTKVNIPVKISDSEAFKSALESYRNYNFDANIMIDGELFKSDDYLLIDEIVIEKNTGLTGRVWVRKNDLGSVISNYKNTVGFCLSGWVYERKETYSFGKKYNTGRHNIIVELKPGVVDFSSSRDEITVNERSTVFYGLIDEKINNKAYLFEKVIENIKTLNRKEMISVIRSLYFFWDAVTFDIDNKKVIFRDRKNSVSIEKPFDAFTTSTGYNPLTSINYHNNDSLFFLAADKTRFVLKVKNKIEEKIKTGNRNYFETYFIEQKNSDGSNVTKIQAKLGDIIQKSASLLEEKKPELSIKRVIFSNLMFENSKYNTILLISGVTQDSLKKLFKYNSTFVKSSKYNETLLALSDKTYDISEFDLELLSSMGIHIKTHTIDEFLEELKEEQKALAYEKSKLVIKDEDKLIIHYHEELTNIKNDEELLKLEQKLFINKNSYSKLSFAGSKKFIKTTIEEVIEENALIILSEKDALIPQILKGAINANRNVFGKKIYVISSPNVSNIRAVHFSKLANYSNVIISNTYSYNSKHATALIRKNSFNDPYLNSEIPLIKLNDFFAPTFSAVFKNVAPDALKESFTEIQKASKNPIIKKVMSELSDDKLISRLGYYSYHYDDILKEETQVLLVKKYGEEFTKVFCKVIEFFTHLIRNKTWGYDSQTGEEYKLILLVNLLFPSRNRHIPNDKRVDWTDPVIITVMEWFDEIFDNFNKSSD